MYDVASARDVAASQVGYHEGKSGGHWNNIQKFSELMSGWDWSDGQAWCATFCQFIFWFVGVKVPAGASSASCATSVAAYKKAKRWTDYPVTGAQVFFGPGGGEHCGYVEKWDATYVYTIEGNSNSTGAAEGDGVYRQKRVRTSANVYGYGIPYYNGKADTPDPAWKGRSMAA